MSASLDDSSDSLRSLLETLGVVLPIILFVSPISAIMQIHEAKDVGNLPPLPLTSMLGNCLLWLLFGFGLQNRSVIIPNVFGVIFASLYCVAYATYCKTGPDRIKLANMRTQLFVVVMLGCFCTMLILVLGAQDTGRFFFGGGADLVGYIAASANIVMIMAPVSKFSVVLETKDTSHLGSRSMAMAGFSCSLVWFLLGWWYILKSQVWGPNLLGVIANLACLALFTIMGPAAGPAPSGAAGGQNKLSAAAPGSPKNKKKQ